MTGIADDPLRTLRPCVSALKSQHPDGIPFFAHFVVNPPRRIWRWSLMHAAFDGATVLFVRKLSIWDCFERIVPSGLGLGMGGRIMVQYLS